jgi:hypothetical protein
MLFLGLRRNPPIGTIPAMSAGVWAAAQTTAPAA